MVRAIPPRHKGRIAIVTKREAGMRWLRMCCWRAVRTRRRNRVVLAPQRLALKPMRSWQASQRATVAIGKVHRGDHV